jgi:Phosphotransferase enzyme family
MISANGVRIGWTDLPEPVVRSTEALLGSPVVAAVSQPGGFSPGTADRVLTADGRRAFVKAVGNSLNEVSVELARQEAHVTAHMPAGAPVPRLLGAFDDGEWVALVYEDVEGRHPRTPWTEAEIDAAAAALADLARLTTPMPVPDLPRASDQHFYNFHGWDQLAADVPADLEPWAAERLDELRAAAARGLAVLAHGDTLAHCDIRADNLLVRPDGRVVIVDWPWGCAGPSWLDRLLLAMNVATHGGDADRLLAGIDPGQAFDVVAGIAGHWQLRGRQPPPPGLPTVRAFQRALGERFLAWLAGRWDLRHIAAGPIPWRTTLESR